MKLPVTLYYVSQYCIHRGILQEKVEKEFLKAHFVVVLKKNICFCEQVCIFLHNFILAKPQKPIKIERRDMLDSFPHQFIKKGEGGDLVPVLQLPCREQQTPTFVSHVGNNLVTISCMAASIFTTVGEVRNILMKLCKKNTKW